MKRYHQQVDCLVGRFRWNRCACVRLHSAFSVWSGSQLNPHRFLSRNYVLQMCGQSQSIQQITNNLTVEYARRSPSFMHFLLLLLLSFFLPLFCSLIFSFVSLSFRLLFRICAEIFVVVVGAFHLVSLQLDALRVEFSNKNNNNITRRQRH